MSAPYQPTATVSPGAMSGNAYIAHILKVDEAALSFSTVLGYHP